MFFGENLPARFFSCLQSVSVPAAPPISVHAGAAGVLPWGRWLPQVAAGGLAAGAGGRQPSLTVCSPFTGLPEGGPPHHHGHLPAGAALRIPYQQVGWGSGLWGAAGHWGSRDRPSPLSSPSTRAPLSTPRLLINKEKTGQVSAFSHTLPPPHRGPTLPPPGLLGNQGTGLWGIPILWTPRLRPKDSGIHRGQVPGCPDSRIPQASVSFTLFFFFF